MSEIHETTGHPDVDAAVEAAVSLEERPIGEHLAAYENAHVLLRQALSDGPGDDPEVRGSADVDEPAG